MRGNVVRLFLITSGLLLLATAAGKVVSALGHKSILWETDPILGLQFRHVLWIVGLCEMFIGVVTIFGRWTNVQLGLLALLATNFMVYRFGLWWIGWKKPCSCMGNLSDALHIKPESADNIMMIVLAYLLIGSYGLLIWQWNVSKSKIEGGRLKMAGTELDASPSSAVSES